MQRWKHKQLWQIIIKRSLNDHGPGLKCDHRTMLGLDIYLEFWAAFFFYLGIEFLLSLADVEVEWMQPLHWRQRPGAPISNDAIFPWLEGSHWLPSPVIYSWRACLGYCYLFTWIYWTTRKMFLKSVKHILFWRLKNDEYCSISTRVSHVFTPLPREAILMLRHTPNELSFFV